MQNDSFLEQQISHAPLTIKQEMTNNFSMSVKQ